jgi:hypothetical protein
MAEYPPLPGTPEHKSLRRKQWGCVLVLLGLIAMLLLVTAYVCLLQTVPLQISKETTYITEPLKSDGKQVDYFAAWEQEAYPDNIATEENGYRLIVRHLGTGPDATPWHSAQISQKLGLDAESIHPAMTLQEPYGYLAAYVKSKGFDEALVEKLMRENGSAEETSTYQSMVEFWPEPHEVLHDRVLDRPWTLDDLPMMEAWLAGNGRALDLIGEAVRKPTFHIPLARGDDSGQLIALLLPEVQWMRSFARALNVRANYRIGAGDIDGAIDDVISCKRLGRNVGQRGMLVQMLVGIAIEGIADAIGIAGSLEHPPSREQLERLVDELDDLPPKGDFEKAMLFEHYAALDVLQAMAHAKVPVDPDLLDEMPARMGLDWNIVAVRVNEHFDGLPGATGYLGPSLNLEALVSRRARSEAMGDEFANFLLPASDAAREALRRNTCVGRMQRITLAMLLYERDHGRLPPAYTVDAEGKPLHSWRVLLLPYLGQQDLHDKIRLDEPWDSEHNRQFHNEEVPFYQCPSAELTPGHTTYSVVVGPDMPFEAGEGKSLSEFGPKSATMILLVERMEVANWMDPRGNVPQAAAGNGINGFDARGAAIGSQHPGGANFGHRDGSVRFLSELIDTEQFKRLLQGTADRIP